MARNERIELDLTRADCECHVLPCSIDYSGAIDRSKFPVATSPQLFARLRGRPLLGKSLDLTAFGYRGVRLECPAQAMSQEPEEVEELEDPGAGESDATALQPAQYVQHGAPFGSIVVWEHGKLPGPRDEWGGRLEDLLRMSSTLESLASV